MNLIRNGAQIITNTAQALGIRSRLAAFLGWSHSGARDLYASFGYPCSIDPMSYFAMYERNDIANRIVCAFPQATWKEFPVVCDDDGDSAEKLDNKGKKNDNYSPFVEAVQDFMEDRDILAMIERADRLASIGRYGVLVFGFKDGQKMEKPLGKGKKELMWMQPYPEANCTVSRWVTDSTDVRWGKPELYSLRQASLSDGQVGPQKAVTVHYSRVIHISEYLDQDDTFGRPRLGPVFNRLMDLEKVMGGGAEVYWLCANRGIIMSADKDVALDDADITDMKQQAEDMSHQVRRTIVGQGITAQVLGSDSPDPGPLVEKLCQLIAGSVGLPMRILLGSERGELASKQDDGNWGQRIAERRGSFGTRFMREFIQLMIDTKNLPQPVGKFYIEWAPHDALGPEASAAVALQKTQALVAYANSPNAPLVMPIGEFRTDVLGLDPESEYEIEPIENPLDEAAIVDENGNQLDQNGNPKLDPQGRPVPGGKASDPAEKDLKAAVLQAQSSIPRSLYVSRKVLNAGVIKAWAKKQGFKNIEDDLHVTIAASRKNLDWTKIYGQAYGDDDEGRHMVKPGGVRIIERIGDGGAVALLFVDNELTYRHMGIKESGASWDFDDYQPHITISYDTGVGITKMEPYTGAIVLGPEIFEEFTEHARAS